MSNRVRVPLGTGEAVYRRACDGLRRWVQFEVGWVEVFPSEMPLEAGRTVAILVRVWGVWSLHACRIVQVIDDQPSEGAWRFGFIYGTLPGHGETGEERFLVEWDRAGGGVSYDVSAFFRPNHWIVRRAWFQLRHRMNRFRRESAEVMQAVADGRR